MLMVDLQRGGAKTKTAQGKCDLRAPNSAALIWGNLICLILIFPEFWRQQNIVVLINKSGNNRPLHHYMSSCKCDSCAAHGTAQSLGINSTVKGVVCNSSFTSDLLLLPLLPALSLTVKKCQNECCLYRRHSWWMIALGPTLADKHIAFPETASRQKPSFTGYFHRTLQQKETLSLLFIPGNIPVDTQLVQPAITAQASAFIFGPQGQSPLCYLIRREIVA